jgi:putative hydrolase of the HAD superfamily
MSNPADARLEAVTFDVGGTLIEPWPSVGHVYCEVARGFGLKHEPEQVSAAFMTAWKARDDFDYSRSAWFELVRQSFGTDVSPALFEAIYEQFAGAQAWRIYDDVVPALQLARDRRLKLAIISNWDERLERILTNLGLRHWFDEVIVSVDAGAHKPDRAIFECASRRLKVPPSQTLHIGDSEREDVQGAANAGFYSAKISRAPGESGLTAVLESFL